MAVFRFLAHPELAGSVENSLPAFADERGRDWIIPS